MTYRLTATPYSKSSSGGALLRSDFPCYFEVSDNLEDLTSTIEAYMNDAQELKNVRKTFSACCVRLTLERFCDTSKEWTVILEDIAYCDF